MAADVLLYNALNEANKVKRDRIATLDAQIAAKNTECQGYINTISNNRKALVNVAGARRPELWGLIPTQPEVGGDFDSGLKVCDESGYYRCGKDCTWAVPAGVSCVRFQIWGAGAGTSSSCCCGFVPIGASGAYASVIMPVTAGDSYVLCAGCAYCCYANNAQMTVQSCPSYVTGNGLTNFCAEGGKSGTYCEMRARGSCGNEQCGYCIYMGGSACICNTGSDVCIYNNQGGYSCAENPSAMDVHNACNTYYGTATSADVYGIQGAYHMQQDTQGAIFCIRHAPIYGFPNESCCACCIAEAARAGLDRAACAGYMQIPGAGGWAGYTCAGCYQSCGDAGRMGMICVSWKA